MPRQITPTTRRKVAADLGKGMGVKEAAKKHHISERSVNNIRADYAAYVGAVAEGVSDADDVRAMTMVEYLQAKTGTAQLIIDRLMDIPPEMLETACLRDRIGAIKVLAEQFVALGTKDAGLTALNQVCEAIRDLSDGPLPGDKTRERSEDDGGEESGL